MIEHNDSGDECDCADCAIDAIERTRGMLGALGEEIDAGIASERDRYPITCNDATWRAIVARGWDRYYIRTQPIPEPIESIDNRVRHLMQGQPKPGPR
jgi:hypothetical protein